MKTKIVLICLVILAMSITTACDEVEGLPVVVDLENSIKEIISSKGEDYDFLSDKQYMSKMHEIVNLFVDSDFLKQEHYVIGNLDDDNIPELVVFRERDPKDVDDQGLLEVYSYELGKYSLLTRVFMNYDNTNYDLKIGKIGPEQNGVLLNNQVGSQSGITYGFILENRKLVSVLNENKINLVSINTENEIRDIDNDGILENRIDSVHTLDPESKEQSSNNSDRIIYWYRWDGRDGAELVTYEELKGESKKNDKSDNDLVKEAERLLSIDRIAFIDYLKENKTNISADDNTRLLEVYFENMKDEAKARALVINNLFTRYQLGNNNDYLYNKYGLSLERLNDTQYLNREKVLNAEPELNNNLINNLKLGYKLIENDDKYSYTIDYQAFLNSFGDCLLKEYRDYYRILALDSNNQYIKNDTLMITMDKLAERIILIDNFKMTYPYSDYIDNLNRIYKDYLYTLLYGGRNNPVFDEETNLIDQDILEEYENIEEKYADTNLASIISNHLREIEEKYKK